MSKIIEYIKSGITKQYKQLNKEQRKQACQKIYQGLVCLQSLGLNPTYAGVNPTIIKARWMEVNADRNYCLITEASVFIREIMEGLKARQEFIIINLPFALRKISRVMPLNEVVLQDAFYNLIIAVERFNPYAGFAFSTYAGYWVTNAIMNYYHTSRYSFKISPQLNNHYLNVSKYIDEVNTKKGYFPTIPELSKHFNKSEKEIVNILNLPTEISANEVVTKDGTEYLEHQSFLESTKVNKKSAEWAQWLESNPVVLDPLGYLFFKHTLEKIKKEEDITPKELADIGNYLKLKKSRTEKQQRLRKKYEV